jgi:FdhD protein
METHRMYKTVRSFTYSGGGFKSRMSHLLVETPLEIVVDGDRRILIMFTPGMIRELVAGFLFTEGLVDKVSDIREIIVRPLEKGDGEQVIEVRVHLLKPVATGTKTSVTRVSYSSCGICGKDNYYELKEALGRVKSRHRFSMSVVRELPVELERLQTLYPRTGGSHAAVLFDEHGNPEVQSEDMGRHNALDKVIGSALLKGIRLDDKILLSSGRASLEMILKTARAGAPVFVAMSRPTSRAVEAAKFYNITLIDMAKDTNRIYTHARRIEGF